MSVSNQVIKILAYAHSNVDTYLRFYSGLKLGVVVTRQILFQSMGAPAHSVAGEDPSWLARHSSLCPSSHTSNSSLVSPVEVLRCSSHVVNSCEHGSLSQSLVVDLVGAGGNRRECVHEPKEGLHVVTPSANLSHGQNRPCIEWLSLGRVWVGDLALLVTLLLLVQQIFNVDTKLLLWLKSSKTSGDWHLTHWPTSLTALPRDSQSTGW